ncbi:class I SAM-dependent methyltransferase [Variovorax terrae]|uniref:Class I SAM-dependent methyltransferase n=1 Tax=Variovorax terrae TaxID=2923278 RepID=A0A9X1VTW1_9BURK|nr:class I SAM-dependent methyltransferase [Variovorax terrae]MCJ0763751.1 class I SAM-dependent methyltransferase [Variovorax terrae]
MQNIYDDPRFFAGYAALRESGLGLNEVLEQPALASLLPPSLAGLSVLDLGCGAGGFARAACSAGARAVVGLDPSERMLAVARSRTPAALPIQWLQQPVEALRPGLAPGAAPFNLVVSSLALHYVPDYADALARIASVMAPGARLAFSVEHPMCTALAAQQWHAGPDGQPQHWPVDGYRDEGARDTHWFIDGVRKYHRCTDTYVNGLLDAGLRLVRLLEPAPAADAIERRPDLALHRRSPPFLLLAADKPG